MPAKSKSQFRLFKYLESHPEEAKKRGIKEEVVNDFTDMSKQRFSKLRERLKKN